MEKTIEALKQELKKRKLLADIYAENAAFTEVQSNDAEITGLKQGIDAGAGLRIFRDGKMGFGYFTDLKPEEAAGFIDKVSSACHAAGYEGYTPGAGGKYEAPETEDADYASTDIEKKKSACIETETAAREADSRVKYSRDTTYYDSVTGYYYFSTQGAEGSFSRTYYSVFTSAIASGGGDSQEFGESIRTSGKFGGIDFRACGKEAGINAAGLMGGSAVSSGVYDIILPSGVACDFVSFLSSLFLSVNARKGKTLLKDAKDGEQVASGIVSLCDDPLMPYGAGTFPFDAEGEAGKKRCLIGSGSFGGFLFDRHNTMLMGRGRPGSCVRGSFKELPVPGASNMYIEPGKTSPQDAVKSGTFIKVNSMMGMHTADPVSGNFSVGINGWLMGNGAVIQPVREILMSGNIRDLLMKISCVCDDLAFRGSFGSPTLVINGLQIAGK